ncbi:hypothetical protein O9992_00720 [Vibrio lentus]|nr:hypothetical protein [Vibrio lentus]
MDSNGAEELKAGLMAMQSEITKTSTTTQISIAMRKTDASTSKLRNKRS